MPLYFHVVFFLVLLKWSETLGAISMFQKLGDMNIIFFWLHWIGKDFDVLALVNIYSDYIRYNSKKSVVVIIFRGKYLRNTSGHKCIWF